MFKKRILVCGYCIELLCDEEIKDSRFFKVFSSEDVPDIKVRVIRDRLPEKEGMLLYASDTVQFYLFDNKKYRFSSYYMPMTSSYMDYAVRIYDGENITLIIDYEKGLWDSMVFEALGLPELLTERSKAILHSSYIIKDGKAILFSADKQVGKSTQAALWEKYSSAKIINGDRAAVGFEDGVAYAYSVPFCGSSEICVNENAPIEAVVLLVRGDVNRIEKVDPLTAFKELLGKVTYNEWDVVQLEKAVDIIQHLVENIPVCKLFCLPDEGAVRILENYLYGEKEG